jgi:hypothetical protein
MNLEDKFNELLKKYPSIFQYNKKIEVVQRKNGKKINFVEFEQFNSKRQHSYPFYKPKSKLFTKSNQTNDDV